MTEKEYKALLPSDRLDEFRTWLAKAYPQAAPAVTKQRNHYYDTLQLKLFLHGITLRVRETANGYDLQLKRREKNNGLVVISEEYCRPINEIPAEISYLDLPLEFDICFYMIGTLETKRTSYFLSADCRVDLDENTYLGIADHEIEIEFINELPETLSAYLSPIAGLDEPKGKYKRFIRRYREMRRDG